jgi:cell wall-associated NlpC family hydrolase
METTTPAWLFQRGRGRNVAADRRSGYGRRFSTALRRLWVLIHRIMRMRLLILVPFAALVAFASAAAAPTPEERAQQTRAQAVLAEIATLDSRMDHVVNAWNEGHARLATLDRQVEANQRALRVARVQLRAARARLAERLVSVYESDQPTIADVILGATSVTDVINGIDNANAVVKQDGRAAAETASAERRFASRARTLASAESRQRRTVARLASARAEISQTLSQRHALLASIQTQIARLQAQQRAHERELAAEARARLARERKAQAVAQRAATPPAAAPPARRATPTAATPPPPAPTPPATPPTTTAPAPAPAPAAPAAPSPGGGHAEAAAIAARYLGVRYQWGGASPSTGFDCSGLVMYVYAQLGVSLPHYTGAQWSSGTAVSRSQLQPGDLVFFDGLAHVGIYIGGNQFIHAPHTGDVVKVSSLSDSWYASHYDGARRIP